MDKFKSAIQNWWYTSLEKRSKKGAVLMIVAFILFFGVHYYFLSK